MTVRRMMGTETEFGISVLGTPSANPMLTSSQVVNAYAAPIARSRRARWDFEEESPLRDARGFDLSRDAADASQLTDEDIGLANVILTNGARLYVDHAHPEYCTPECTNPRDVVRLGQGGRADRGRGRCRRRHPRPERTRAVQEQHRQQGCVLRQPRELPDEAVDAVPGHRPAPDAVLRQPPGRVRRRTGRDRAGRARARRSRSASGPTTSRSRSDWRRPSSGRSSTPATSRMPTPRSIGGCTSSSATPTCRRSRRYLKVGTTALVLAMIEDRAITTELAIDGPVTELHKVSHDPTLRHKVQLKDGRVMTALDVQEPYLELSQRLRRRALWRRRRRPDAATCSPVGSRSSTGCAATRWRCRKELDWVAKLALLESYRDRDGLEWDDPKLHLIDLQYADLRPDKGLYQRLVARGSIERLARRATRWQGSHASRPEDTRAYFRGRCLAQYPDRIAAASWDSVIFDLPGRDSLQRIPTMEPLAWHRAARRSTPGPVRAPPRSCSPPSPPDPRTVTPDRPAVRFLTREPPIERGYRALCQATGQVGL